MCPIHPGLRKISEQVKVMTLRVKNVLMRTLKTLLMPIVVYVVFFALAPKNFGSPYAMYIVLMQSVVPSLIGFGIAFNLLVRAWDLSAGAVVTLTAMFAGYASLNYGIAGLIIVSLVVAFLLHTLTGTVFTLLRIPSIITTIGMMLVYESVSQLYKGGQILSVNSSYAVLATFPYIFIILIVAAVLFYLILNYTKFGYNVNAVGNSPVIAKSTGINPRKVKYLCFIVGAFFLGIGSLLYASYSGTVGMQANMATLTLTFTPIMGVVLGMYLSQFCGLTLGIIIGEITINMINSGLIATGMSASMQKIATGLALLIVLAFTGLRDHLAQKKAQRQLFINAEKAETNN